VGGGSKSRELISKGIDCECGLWGGGSLVFLCVSVFEEGRQNLIMKEQSEDRRFIYARCKCFRIYFRWDNFDLAWLKVAH
jgi:hypothetical protein